MTKLELKSSHEVIDTVDVADIESIFCCKPTDPDILTVLMKDGKRLYCDEVCPVDSMQEVPCNNCQGFNSKEKCDELVFGYNCPIVKKPVSIWHDSNKEQPNYASTVAIWNPKYKNGEIISRCTEVYSDRIWAYIDDLLKM